MKKHLLIALLLVASITACKKGEEVVSPTNNNTGVVSITANTPTKFSANINGNNVSYTVDNTDYVEMQSGSQFFSDSTYLIYNNFINRKVGTDIINVIALSKGTLAIAGVSDLDTLSFSNFYNVGVHYFSDYADKGFELEWIDDNNVKWTTSGVEQPDSRFNITQKITYKKDGYYYVKYKAAFFCNLTNGRETIKLTNGSMIGSFSL